MYHDYIHTEKTSVGNQKPIVDKSATSDDYTPARARESTHTRKRVNYVRDPFARTPAPRRRECARGGVWSPPSDLRDVPPRLHERRNGTRGSAEIRRE